MNKIKNMITVFITIVIFFSIGEIYFRFIDPQDNMEFIADKDLYWTAKPNQKSRILMGSGTQWSPITTINSIGLRSDEIKLDASEKRILFLGDSFTFGEGVKDNETTPSRLSEILKYDNISGFNIINGGMRGWGVFQMQRLLYNNFNKFNPEIVILIYKEGDEIRQPFKSIEEEKQYMKKHTFQNKLRKISKFITWIYRKIVILRSRLQNKGVDNYIPVDEINLRKDLISNDLIRIDSINNYCKKNNIDFLLVGWLDKDPRLDSKLTKIFKDKLIKFSNTNNVPLLLIGDSIFPEKYSEDELKIAGDGHPTALSHKLSAGMIFDKLMQLDWLSDQRDDDKL